MKPLNLNFAIKGLFTHKQKLMSNFHTTDHLFLNTQTSMDQLIILRTQVYWFIVSLKGKVFALRNRILRTVMIRRIY